MAEIAVSPPRRNRLLLTQWSELLENDAFRRFFLMRLASTGAMNALSYALLVFTVFRLGGGAANYRDGRRGNCIRGRSDRKRIHSLRRGSLSSCETHHLLTGMPGR